MDCIEESGCSSLNPNEEANGKWNQRSKRHAKKKISLVYLLKVICASQETCLDWLKNKGLIPKVMFCPNCSKKMRFEPQEQAVDGYIWICRECKIDQPKFSTRHGSWLDGKTASLVDILLFTYLWAHGFSEVQILKEMNMNIKDYREWDSLYTEICEALHRKKYSNDTEAEDENILKINNKEAPVVTWRKKNKYKDPFMEFLKDADSL